MAVENGYKAKYQIKLELFLKDNRYVYELYSFLYKIQTTHSKDQHRTGVVV